ncbi:molybdopterin-dependent oxidoreductase [Plesiomonas shigelloides subsp. oncorhynchi]|nr:molybdopterin-dependent oxidoreductase [Plesiomonas shigelloides]
MTRTNGSKSCSNIWSRCDDQPLGRYQNANLIVVMGGNAAEAHPVGFRWAMEAKIHNNAKIIVIDPRFTRTASVADFYTPIAREPTLRSCPA